MIKEGNFLGFEWKRQVMCLEKYGGVPTEAYGPSKQVLWRNKFYLPCKIKDIADLLILVFQFKYKFYLVKM